VCKVGPETKKFSLRATHGVDAAADSQTSDAAQLVTAMQFVQPHNKSTAFGKNKAGTAIY